MSRRRTQFLRSLEQAGGDISRILPQKHEGRGRSQRWDPKGAQFIRGVRSKEAGTLPPSPRKRALYKKWAEEAGYDV